jgi:hypothetical protein
MRRTMRAGARRRKLPFAGENHQDAGIDSVDALVRLVAREGELWKGEHLGTFRG